MDENSIDTFIQLVAGGVGGTTGAIITCPLEVVKTRLQSSNSGFDGAPPIGKGPPVPTNDTGHSSAKAKPTTFFKQGLAIPSDVVSQRSSQSSGTCTGRELFLRAPERSGILLRSYESSLKLPNRFYSSQPPPQPRPNVLQCLRYILVHEGISGMFKGLGPNIMGVAPTRAIYFWSYNTCKKKIDASVPKANRDTSLVHVVSAAAAGFSASTVTNPIWLIKTRLQLDRSSHNSSLSIRKCTISIYKELGVFGFWKGVTASYWGVSETIIHFVIYEHLKYKLAKYQNKHKDGEKTFVDFAGFMLCGACSRSCATIIAYPHEVARTRLREEGSKYRGFWPCLIAVYQTEGRPGLYRGLVTQLIRQIPNTAIMMATYEFTAHLLTKWLKSPGSEPAKTKDEKLLCKSSHSQ